MRYSDGAASGKQDSSDSHVTEIGKRLAYSLGLLRSQKLYVWSLEPQGSNAEPGSTNSEGDDRTRDKSGLDEKIPPGFLDRLTDLRTHLDTLSSGTRRVKTSGEGEQEQVSSSRR